MQGRLVAIAGSILAVGWLVGAAPAGAASPQEVTVSGTEFSFEPQQITVSSGEELVITFRNEGTIAHNFTVSGLDAGTGTIQAGETAELRVTPTESGTYSVICSVPGHAERGMRGEIMVN